MSAIVGIINFDTAESVNRNVLQSMADIISYRGPDDEGFYVRGNVGLAHKRLSIIDLKTGHQPMCNESETLWIIHDGEIFNYIELREELESKGHTFKSNTSTEVIIHAYEEWGYDCLQRFNGMWAFALWDIRHNKLFCARDQLGIKPFYYYFNDELFVFASEIKALFNHPKAPKKVNEEAVYDYLVYLDAGWFGYSDGTFFKDIKQLRPAHYLLVDAKGKLDIKKWWSVRVNPALEGASGNNIDDVVEHFLALLEDAIRLRLRSDVPIGISLSGGLDSSSIVCLANKLILDERIVDPLLIGDRLKTFSSCYEDKRFDERKFIQEVLERTGAEENYVFPDGTQLWEELPKLVWHEDEPFSTTSVYAEWTLRKKAAMRGVKVVLDGQGGDELLAGYSFYYQAFLTDLALKGRMLKLLAKAKERSAIIGVRNASFLTAMALGSALYWILPRPLQSAAKSLFLNLSGKNTSKALNPSFNKEFSRQRSVSFEEYNREYSKSTTSFQGSIYKSLSTSLTQYLRYADRDAMAFSIEARIPLLDYRLVEYVFSLPASLKIRDGWTKWVLRQAMQGILPEEVRLRKDKQGFPTPEGIWLRQNRERIKALFSAKNVLSGDFINLKFIRDNLDNLLSQGTISSEIWRYINLELWLQVFFGNKQNLKKE